MPDLTLIIIMTLAFAAVTAIIFASSQYYLNRVQIRRRLPVTTQSPIAPAGSRSGAAHALITEHFTEERYGVDVALRPAAVAATATATAEPLSTRGSTAQRNGASRRVPVAAKGSATVAPPVASRPSCAQPFFIDSDGIKKFRPECR